MNWRRRLFSLPPIDWALLAAERKGPTRKGEKRALWEVEKQKAGRRAGKERRAKERAARVRKRLEEREAARPRKRPPAPLALTTDFRIVMAMDPGRWYARSDVGRAAGTPRGSAKARMPRMAEAKILERVKNPEWVPSGGVAADGGRLGSSEPEWLYRLTPAGERLRRFALALM